MQEVEQLPSASTNTQPRQAVFYAQRKANEAAGYLLKNTLPTGYLVVILIHGKNCE
jgi:hypothetical protein